jgi:hypothetical protein
MVLLVHPQEGTIRAFDLSAPEQESGFAIFGTKIYVNRLTQQKSMKQSSINMWKMVDDLASQNILRSFFVARKVGSRSAYLTLFFFFLYDSVFTKNGGMEFIMFDLKEDVLVFAQTPDVQIMTLHPLTKSLWLVQSRNETKYYIQRCVYYVYYEKFSPLVFIIDSMPMIDSTMENLVCEPFNPTNQTSTMVALSLTTIIFHLKPTQRY